MFVDISGFTALTERLARRGKIGAELMRDTLDGVFTALLDEAYDWGAGLLKWGGDALLLLFDGPDHERARRARLGDAADDRPGRPAARRRRDADAADVRRDRDRDVPLLHDRQRPSRAADRRAGRDRDGRDGGRSPTPARSASAARSPRSPRPGLRRAARRSGALCSPRRPRSSGGRRRTSATSTASTSRRASRSRPARTCC